MSNWTGKRNKAQLGQVMSSELNGSSMFYMDILVFKIPEDYFMVVSHGENSVKRMMRQSNKIICYMFGNRSYMRVRSTYDN